MKWKDKECLHLVLMKDPFERIARGIKKIEYRDKTPYWEKRLKNKEIKWIFFQYAYHKNPSHMVVEVKDKKLLNKNYTIVNSLLLGTSERPEVKIDWRIYTKEPSNPLIRDLIIEGLSLARTQKEEFNSILNSNNGDINALFKILENFSKN